MKIKWLLAGLALSVIISIGLLVTSAQTSATTSYACTGDFQAGITQGPDSGFAVKGKLELDVKDRAASGTLTLDNGGTVTVGGQVDGRAVNLAFEVSGGKYMFGVGTSTDNFANCTGKAGGPLAGPQSGDLGDWGYAIGG